MRVEADGYTAAVEPWRAVLIQKWEQTRLTLNELAGKSGLNRGTIHRILDNKTKRPGYFTVARLAKALGLTVDELQQLADDMESRPGKVPGNAAEDHSAELAVADRLADLFAYIQSLKEPTRGQFIRGLAALLAAIEHARPIASSGTPPDDGR